MSVYDLMAKEGEKKGEFYYFIFFDIRNIEHLINNLIDKFNNLFPRTYFIIINDDKKDITPKIANRILAQITIKEDFVFENFSAKVKTLIEIGNKNRHYISQTNKLLNICDNIKALCDSIPTEQEFDLNEELKNQHLEKYILKQL
jgi:hypothetical protein